MVMGPSGCGKTTLVNALNNYHGKLKRTQDMIYGRNTIDVPGAYLESPWMYKHIISAAQDASHVLLLVDQSRRKDVYPHGFARAFRCPVIGIITKCDLMPENKENCLRQLKMTGVCGPYFEISPSGGIEMEALKKYLLETGKERGPL